MALQLDNKLLDAAISKVRNAVRSLRATMTAKNKFENDFEMSAVIDCVASTTTIAIIQVPANGDFLIEGYNASFRLSAAGFPSLLVKIQDETSGIPWSPDPVPVELIATPGAIISGTSPVRYGMRLWSYLVPANAKLSIAVENTDTSNREFKITFKGKLLKA